MIDRYQAIAIIRTDVRHDGRNRLVAVDHCMTPARTNKAPGTDRSTIVASSRSSADIAAIIFHQQHSPAVHGGSLAKRVVNIIPASGAVDERFFVSYMT